MDRNQIREEAKKIMDDFVNSMGNFDSEDDFFLKRSSYKREEEGEGNITSNEFLEEFLKNAPEATEKAILTEKGKWEK